MNLTFAEIIELGPQTGEPTQTQPQPEAPATAEVPAEQLPQGGTYQASTQPPTTRQQRQGIDDMENEAGVGFLSPDGRQVIGMWDARKLFWRTFGENQQVFHNRTGVWYDEALIAVGLVFVNGSNIQVGMRGKETLGSEQFRAIDTYLRTYLPPTQKVSVMGLWHDPRTYAFQGEKVLYQGPANQFHTMAGGTTDVTMPVQGKPSAVQYQYKGGAVDITFSMIKLADLANQLVNEQVLRAQKAKARRERIKRNREEITLEPYQHYSIMPVIKWEGDEYALATDEMADHAARDSAEQALEEGIMNIDWLEYYVDGDRVANDYATNDERYAEQARDDWRDYIELEEGQEEPTDEQLEEVEEKIKEEHHKEIADDPVSYLRDIYGQEELGQHIRQYVNEEEVIQGAIRDDGRGHFLSSYDGEERDLDDLDGMELYDLPDEVLDELGVARNSKEHIYAYRVG